MHDADGCIFPPIGELLKLAGLNFSSFLSAAESSYSMHSKRPPHAMLPEDIEDEIPVHGANERLDQGLKYHFRCT